MQVVLFENGFLREPSLRTLRLSLLSLYLSLPARDEWGEIDRERKKPTSSPRPSAPFGEEREERFPSHPFTPPRRETTIGATGEVPLLGAIRARFLFEHLTFLRSSELRSKLFA